MVTHTESHYSKSNTTETTIFINHLYLLKLMAQQGVDKNVWIYQNETQLIIKPIETYKIK